MPKLIIDNREVTVPEGTNVLEAAKQLGIVIPHFCYHEALGAVGSCRLCAMTFLEGPVEGVKMACMIPAQDEMVVSTVDPEAMELREHVIEWMMTNHPHDCPVCDEGGECMLQDMTIAGGHYLRRYRGKKATYTNQDLGPFIEQEMNRCIACYRCKRTYRDYCGGSDFGVFGSRNRVFFGRYREGQLESPFSGNLADVCPTGVFTDKTFRFKSRVWDLQQAPSICPHCSLGCSTVPGGRLRELQRVKAGINEETNGFFICDRGRFGYGHANHTERPREPRVDGQAVAMSEAISAARSRIEAIVAKHGAESVAFLGSSRASFEANLLLKRWAAQIGSTRLLFEAHQGRDQAARTLAARLGQQARSLADVRKSDLIILAGADPLAEGPVLALVIRQAVRAGGDVMVIDPRPVALPCAHTHLPVTPEQLPAALAALPTGTMESLVPQDQATLKDLSEKLGRAERPILIGGAALLSGPGVTALLDAAIALSTPERTLGVMTLLGGPNSFGGALLAEAGPDFETLIDALQEGQVRALVCLEADPFRDAQYPAKAQAALGHLEQLISLDCTPSLAAQRANILLPTRVTAEMAGSYVNNEGRLQAFLPVIEPGLSIRETEEGNHPPRQFEHGTPGSAPEPAWQILAEVLDCPTQLNELRQNLANADNRFAALASVTAEAPGVRLNTPGTLPPTPASELPHATTDTLSLLTTGAFVGSDWLAQLSAPLAPLRAKPTVWLHPEQAVELSLQDGDRAILTTQLGHCHVDVHISSDMVPGLVLTHQLLDSALEGLCPGTLVDCRLEKELSR